MVSLKPITKGFYVLSNFSEKIGVETCTKILEKGVDVKLATHMLVDAINNKYDVALLFSNDADFSPAISHIVKSLNKRIIYCHFPMSRTNELKEVCSESRLISKDIVDKSTN